MKSNPSSQCNFTSYARDISKPLFTGEYFKEQLERSRAIDKEYQKARLNKLYSATVSRNQSFNM
jgi:hypothetical protein